MAGVALEYVQTTMVNSQGLHLAVYKWEVEDPKAIVYMAHGHLNHARFEYYTRSAIGEPRNQYKGSWVHALNESGYTVVSMDYQGHGCSDGVVEGMKGYFHRYDDLVKDFIEVHYSSAPACSHAVGMRAYCANGFLHRADDSRN